jgi:hypothetical protein
VRLPAQAFGESFLWSMTCWFGGEVPELFRFLSERSLNAQFSLYGLDEEDNNAEG